MVTFYILSVFIFPIVLYIFLKKYYTLRWYKSISISIMTLVGFFVVFMTINFPIRTYIVQSFILKGSAMAPTYTHENYVLVKKFTHAHSRGDVIIYNTQQKSEPFIHRIIGLPGEEISIRDGHIFINGTVFDDPFTEEETPGEIHITLPDDAYFVLGDNRNNSSDSRIFGAIPENTIVGTVFYNFSK